MDEDERLTPSKLAEQMLEKYFPKDTRRTLEIEGRLYVGVSCTECGAWVQMDALQALTMEKPTPFSIHVGWHHAIVWDPR